MSATGVVILVLGLGFAAGFTAALRFGPSAPETREGSLIFFTSRLVAGAAVAAGALDVYAAFKTRALAEELLGEAAPQRFAEQLGGAAFDAGILLVLACALAVLGLRLPARN